MSLVKLRRENVNLIVWTSSRLSGGLSRLAPTAGAAQAHSSTSHSGLCQQQPEAVFKSYLLALGKKHNKIIWIFFQLSLFVTVLKKVLVQRPELRNCKSLERYQVEIWNDARLGEALSLTLAQQ